MKKIKFLSGCLILSGIIFLTGCYKLQKDYDYVKQEIDPHYDMTVKQYFLSRGVNGVGGDTIFKWMQLGLEYAGIDLAELEKPGRTFILLHNSAIRTLSPGPPTSSIPKGKTNGGFFFDYPIVVKDANGNVIKSKVDPTMDSTQPAMYWNEYPKQLVKDYLSYMIIQGEYGFDNIGITNQSVLTSLPPGTVASPKDSKLGWVVVKTTPNPDPTLATSITMVPGGGNGGFDPEGRMNFRMGNNDQSPIVINDRINDRTAGFYFTNGRAHVFDKTIHPFRYSWQ
jgi:hypothetical protein